MASDPVRYSGDNAPIGDLLKRLIEDTGHLVRTELRLAKSEMRDNVKGLAGGAVMMVASVVFFIAALGTLLAAFVGWLTPMVGDGWAAFIVAVAAAVIGFILLSVGRKKMSAVSLTPEHTIASVKADVETIKGN